MYSHSKDIKIFSANSNKPLAEAICQRLGLPMGDSEVKTFADGEVSVSINETVRGCDVFVIQSTCKPVNDSLMELLILIDAHPLPVSLPLSPTSAMPVRTVRPRPAIPSPQSWWQTSSPLPVLTVC